jgi:hypothetical protein
MTKLLAATTGAAEALGSFAWLVGVGLADGDGLDDGALVLWLMANATIAPPTMSTTRTARIAFRFISLSP